MRPVWAIVAAVLALACLPGAAAADLSPIPRPHEWVPNSSVEAVALDGGTLYLAGNFTRMARRTGSLLAVDPGTGATIAGMPAVGGGSISAVEPDGAGGWFIGGSFTSVAGAPRGGLAHIRGDGSVDPAFDVTIKRGMLPRAIVDLDREGSVLYVAGRFSYVGNEFRDGLAAVSTTTGEPTRWSPLPEPVSDTTDPLVRMVVADGDIVYAGGTFGGIGGTSRSRLAALQASDGKATAWDPHIDVDAFSDVDALVIDGGVVHIAGRFTVAGGAARHNVATLRRDTGAATSFDADVTGERVSDLLLDGGTLYLGGDIPTVGGADRTGLAAVDATTGAVLPFAPELVDPATGSEPGEGVSASGLALRGSTLYFTGGFTSLAGQPRDGIAAVEVPSGTLTDFAPHPNGDAAVGATASGTIIYGSFASTDGVGRAGLAAVDAATGALLPWNPGPVAHADSSGIVDIPALAVAGGVVYVGGRFDFVGGVARRSLAAIDGTTGAVLPWNPGGLDWYDNGFFVHPEVHALAAVGDDLYIGGHFTEIAGVDRKYLARVSRTTGAVAAWNPGAPWTVRALLPAGDTVYAGGDEREHFKGQVSAIRVSDAGRRWTAHTTGGGVFALALSGSRVYAGGGFTSMAGAARGKLAALATADGALTAWDPHMLEEPETIFDSVVWSLAALGGRIYAGGDFRWFNAGGTLIERHSFAELDGLSGAVTSWAPDPGPGTSAMDVDAGRLAIGGFFGSTRLSSQAFEAIFEAEAGPPKLTRRPELELPEGGTLGDQFTCRGGEWTGARPIALAYRWLRDGVAIAGATTSAYRTGDADAGHAVACEVTARNGLGSATARSDRYRPFDEVPNNIQAPQIAGTLKPGHTVTCSIGRWTYGTTPTYSIRWLRDYQPIPGAVGSTYAISSADDGHGLACSVTATNRAGSSTMSSVGVAIWVGGPPPYLLGSSPYISGVAVVGSRLTCWPGNWQGLLPFAFAFTWLRDGAPVATGASYTATAQDAGHRLACRVTASNDAGSATADSAAMTVGGAGGGGGGGGPGPAGSLAVSRQRLRAVLRHGLVARVRCTRPPSAQRLTLLVASRTARGLRLRSTRVGGALRRCSDGLAHAVRIRLTRPARRALKHRRSFALVVRLVTVPDDGSGGTVVSRSVKLR